MLRITFSNTLLIPLVTGASTRAPDWPQIPVPNISGAGGGGRWKEPRSPLLKGKLEGWVKVRPAGHTDWKRVLAVVTAGTGSTISNTSEFGANGDGRPVSPTHSTLVKRNRMSSLFGSGNKDATRSSSPPPQSLQSKPVISLYAGSKPKERKAPLLTMTDVTHAFCVYPDRKELIPLSSLIKVEGKLGEQDWVGTVEGSNGVGTMKGREGWMFIMPESESGDGHATGLAPPVEMLKWVVGTTIYLFWNRLGSLTTLFPHSMTGLHDAFELHGRPKGYTWDPYAPASPMFAYPVGDERDVSKSSPEHTMIADNRITSFRTCFFNERTPR